jgi:hypothetical protein
MKTKNLFLTASATIVLAFANMAQVPSYVPSNGLVGWWPFNGNAQDESGNGNDGTVNGATLTIDRLGQANKAYSFNSNFLGHYSGADFIRCNFPGPIGNSNRTFSFWIKTDSLSIATQNNTVLSYGGNEFDYGEQFRIVFGWDCNQSIAGINYSGVKEAPFTPSNSWQLITIVYDSNNGLNSTGIRIYINANLSQSYCSEINGLNFNTSALNPITFGRYHDINWVSDPGFFRGFLDDIGIWNRALTQQEITLLYLSCELSVNTQPTNQTATTDSNVQFAVGTAEPNATFQWQSNLGLGWQNVSNAGQYSGATSNTLLISNVTPANNNQAFRCIVSSGSCADTSDSALLTVVDNSAIQNLSQPGQLFVFPNPAKDQITVECAASLIGKPYRITDASGKVAASGTFTGTQETISLERFAAGIYTLSLEDGIRQSFKIIKE